MEFHPIEKKLIDTLKSLGKKLLTENDLAGSSGLGIDQVYRGMAWLCEKKVCSISVSRKEIFELSSSKVLPEEQLVELLVSSGKPIPIFSLPNELKSFGLQWAKKNGWVKIKDGTVVLVADPKSISNGPLRILINSSSSGPVVLSGQELELAKVLVKRGLGSIKTVSEQSYSIDLSVLDSLSVQEESDMVSSLDSKSLSSGEWREKGFRPFTISKNVPTRFPAQHHIVSRLANRIRGIFLSMGFSEMKGDIVEQSMWNFDALFQPQDHPARELADTFYFDEKSSPEIDLKTIQKIKEEHEQNWHYSWDIEESKRYVLRTHTTCLSVRKLYELAELPLEQRHGKFFAIGKVFRNEATDFKHLAEFFQVEGIIVWKQGNLSNLLGTLKEFYSKLGFEKIRFRPSYFPYTEPSLEIEVFFEEKGEWLELGGAGVFRPEVSIPVCGVYPVLAWGLSLERPLMLLNEMDDIRKFYTNELRWLRDTKQ